ncbi:DUF6527 family protein [Pandoraea pneumonica]|uniref:DUF6527 family protein n=1 Tax=Pandoraea pneumonica TaxID=2508299 RepID=UPI003CED15E5
MKSTKFKYEWVTSIPEVLQPGIVYVARAGDVAGHACACGCAREVITPLSPTDWTLTFDRRGVTLDPSIGNWAFACRSHYFIIDGAVVWASGMSAKAIAHGRQRDKRRKQIYYKNLSATPPAAQASDVAPTAISLRVYVQRLITWWRTIFQR